MAARVDKAVRRKINSKCKCSNGKSENILKQSVGLRPILIFVAASLITALLLETFPHTKQFLVKWNVEEYLEYQHQPTPTYALLLNGSKEAHLEHVISVLHKLGYKRVGVNDSWNLLWSHQYPFFKLSLTELGKHQVVNHFPGCGFLTSKVDLSTSRFPFQPQAFRLPEESDAFLKYAQEHPDTLFVQKNNRHRHIKLKEPSEIDLTSNDSFVQEFIHRPFLVDGHKFDIGVYVVITSVNPLRVYIYTGDVMFRYCPVKYYPFDAEDIGKYVVAENFLPPWKIPALEKYYSRFGGNRRTSFEAYVRDQGKDSAQIWTQVEDIIRATVMAKEKDIMRVLQSFRTHNFFDLMRFDLFIDEHLRVFLMEVNMSPNLSSAFVPENSLLFEQVLYSALNLVGIRSISATAGIRYGEESEMLTIDKNLSTDLNQCAAHNCDESCDKEECNLCLQCLNELEYEILQKAYQEHFNRVSMKRILPKPIHELQNFNMTEKTLNKTQRNVWMARWFYKKCQYDATWCT
ncbi:probable tubulin polyglutamylase ttll-15 [Drosophila rhopaloa]|uniref:Tubulin polyglutamylase TTLL6 n=1 Tax=Drosophila rhopaloa TaxID=1041015 RepID=A0ABM5J251_DRORH|nr:probable tubulin polyglutamylase ttll-15 [Drosophila rhopaloa]